MTGTIRLSKGVRREALRFSALRFSAGDLKKADDEISEATYRKRI